MSDEIEKKLFLEHMALRAKKGMGWSIETELDPDGEEVFIEDFVQGMWVGWRARSHIKPTN
ncbi:hypothetical protein [Enterobacter roggenkampii]|uniref:hypothetical protein n=1 Tax=Enterobacter roggenkampii TaxID=1812935 RepID=UPI001330ED03|nr:hypothetical protein [Enterobacter roggenkampii]